MGIKSVSDLMGESSTNTSDAEGGSGGSSSGAKYAELKAACEAIGANYESVREYVDENGKKTEIIEQAEMLENNPEAMRAAEEYRQFSHMKGIVQNFMWNMDDHEFTVWSGQFWGDTDDPEPDTFNYAQQQARELGVNLPWYDALFPVPQTEYWDGDAVEFTHIEKKDWTIYVPEWWVAEYEAYAKEVNGQVLPMPPSDSEIEAMQSGDSDATESVDESDERPDAPHAIDTETANDAQKTIRNGGWSLDELKKLRKLEVESERTKKGGRKTVRNLLDEKINAARENSGSDESDEQATLDDTPESDGSDDGMSREEFVGQVSATSGEHPDVIRGMLKAGLDRDEIRERV